MIYVKLKKHSIVATVLLSFFLIPVFAAPVSALTTKEGFYQNNGIFFYSPGGATQCKSTSLGSANLTNGNKDYKGRQIISDEQLKKIAEYQPIYEKASEETKIPWQVFAVVHIRETNLLKGNPGPSTDGRLQGIYQDSAQSGALDKNNPYPTGEVDDTEFLRQTIWAGNFLREKAGSKVELVEKGDPDAIKDMFFSYNGRAAVYVVQAKQVLGGTAAGYEGSPYVMNKADEKRDPDVNGDSWGQIKTDGGEISYPAHGDYGAFVMYAALAGAPLMSGASGAACAGMAMGASANGWALDKMAVFYQDKDPWASQAYGIGTMLGCACGPTSVSMAVASLNGMSESAMNPKIMADFFVANGGQIGGGNCGSYLPTENSQIGIALKTTYNLSITEFGTDTSKVADAIKRGSFVLVSTDLGGGHILLIRGITDSGKFVLADPSATGGWLGQSSSQTNTENEAGFTPDQLLIKGLYEIRKA